MIQKDINENTTIWFGRYAGTKIKDLPAWYIKWLKINGFAGVKRYLEEKDNK